MVDRVICSAKVSKLVEEGSHLEKFQRFLCVCAVIVHSERHYHVNEIDLFPVVSTKIELNRSNTKLAINTSYRLNCKWDIGLYKI